MKARALLGGWRRRAAVVLLGSALGTALGWWRLAERAPRATALQLTAQGVPRPLARSAEAEADRRCLAERAAAAALPALELPPSASPPLRPQLLGRAKAAPVLFLSRPEEERSQRARQLRADLEAQPGYEAFGRVVGEVRREPALARAVFFREGYFYTENPELAVLYASLTLALFFREPELRIARGAEDLTARRLDDGDYEYTSGEERGRRAKLLLFDRVSAASTPVGDPRHVELGQLARELGFDELDLEHASARTLVVHAVYGDLRVPTLLEVGKGRATLRCEAPGDKRAQLLSLRERARRAARAADALVSVIKEQVDEALPFDEPKTEEGQQDGKLRPEWRSAYLNGNTSFEFNGDRYAVFDSSGRPRPPQVCIDFVLDTLERASGTWWRSLGEARERRVGRLSFDRSGMENRRSVERFIEFARGHEEAFEVYDVPPEGRVPFRSRASFFAALYGARAQYKRGDIVAILGPRADEKLHYHSFIIVGTDPLSGMPTELAANAGRPRIRSWEGEMTSAPRRSIVARVRPRQLWLESLLTPDGSGFGAGDRRSDVSAEEPPPAALPDALPDALPEGRGAG